MFKRSVVVLLLPLYVLTSLGSLAPYWTLFHRTSFRLRINKGEFEDLAVFNLTHKEFNDLDWTEKGREFLWEEKMFDIASIQETPTGFRVTAKHDEAESLARKLFPKAHEKQKRNSQTKKRPSSKLYNKQNFNKLAFSALLAEHQSLWKNNNPQLSLPEIYYDIESPPPETIFFI